MQKVLLIGGPGSISTSTARDLLDRNMQVGVLKRNFSNDDGIMKNLKAYYGDRNNPEDIKRVLDDFKPDIVIDFVCFTPLQAQQLADLICGRVSQFIFISTVDVYGFPLSRLPMREDDPWGPPNCKYAADKRACEEIFQSRSDKDKLPLTIARPAYSMSNGFVKTALSRQGGKYLIPRLRAGMPVLVPGDGTTLMHAGCAYNTGRMVARMAGNMSCIGKSYTCAHDYFITHDDYIRIFAGVLGVEPNIVHIPTDILNAMGTGEIKASILNDLTRYNVAFSVENFIRDFPDFKWEMSLQDAAREYVRWNDEKGNFPDAGVEIYEDRIIKAWQELTRGFSVSCEGIEFKA